MAAEMTPKENVMALLHGEIPQSILSYNMGAPRPNAPTRSIGPNLFNDTSRSGKGGKDIWGVPYVANEETGWASLPEPGNFILDDITKWRDVIKRPEVPDVDWAKMAEEDYAKSGIDRNISAVMVGTGFQPFQQLIGFMGFTEGLCAIFEEPEEVKELLNYIADFYVPIIEKALDYYKPDFYKMGDDTASRYNPFFSPAVYKDIFKPVYMKLARPAIERGLPIEFHNCGRCEDFLDDMFDFNVRMWDPAQTDNNLLAVKEKFGRKLAIVGGWSITDFPDWPNVSEEEIVESIHKAIDKLAPNGGYMFAGGVLQQKNDEHLQHIQELVRNTANEYGHLYYERH